jgi:hypothetical protein
MTNREKAEQRRVYEANEKVRIAAQLSQREAEERSKYETLKAKFER